MNKKTAIIILTVILLIGGFLRFYELGNSAFDRDEFFELNTSYGYFKSGSFVAWNFGKEQPFGPEMQDDTSNERAEIFRWQLAQLYRFHEPTEGLTRGLGAAWGVLGVLFVYVVAVSMTGNPVIALIAAFLTAIGYSEVLYSRRLRMYAMLFPAYLFFSWITFKFYESKYMGKVKIFSKINEKTGFNFSYFLPVIAAGLVSYNVHVLSAHIIPAVTVYSLLFLILLLYGLHKKKIPWKNIYSNKYFITVAASALGFIAFQLPFFGRFYKIISKNFRFFLSKPNYDFFNQYFSDFTYVITGIILVLFGAWFLAKKMKKGREAGFLFFSAAVPLAFAIFTWRRDVSHRYIYFIQSFGIILSAVGIYGVIQFAVEFIKNRNYKKILAAGILIFFIFGLNLGYIFSKKSDIYAQRSYYPDFKPVFDYVARHKSPDDVMITRAYRSFYWKGDSIKVYDVKSLGFGSKNCGDKIGRIVKENPSGWVVFPKIDKITVCAEGRKYYEENLTLVKDGSIPSSVLIYRWGQ